MPSTAGRGCDLFEACRAHSSPAKAMLGLRSFPVERDASPKTVPTLIHPQNFLGFVQLGARLSSYPIWTIGCLGTLPLFVAGPFHVSTIKGDR